MNVNLRDAQMNIEKLLSQARSYESEGAFDQAASCYHEVLARESKHVFALTRLGVLALARGNSKEALVMLKWARELAPTDAGVISAWTALQGGNSEPVISGLVEGGASSSTLCGNSLNILFLQNTPCIRNYKMATALRSRGHRVSLGYTINRLSQRYPGLSDDTYDENIHIASYRQLWDISKNYDLIHSHNEPDDLTVAALAGDCPVIHDTHDLISLRANGDSGLVYFEGIANRGADGRIATTPFQEREINEMYGPGNPSLVFYNYASQADLPKRFHSKLSARDGEIHFVYEGGLSESAHRDFREIFVEMAVRGVHVHIYPASWSEKLAAFFGRHKRIHYYKPVSPKVLMEEMTRYDIGIIPWNLEKGNKRFLDSTIANKLFEYLAAGLPVATSRLQSYEDFFARTPVGVTFDSVQELVEVKVSRLMEMASNIDFSKHVYTFENEIQRVEEFYRCLLRKKNSKTAIVVDDSPIRTSSISVRKHGEVAVRADSYADQDGDATTQRAFERFTRWLMDYGWDGYDPYDVDDFIMNLQRQGYTLSDEEKQNLRTAGQKDPMGVREKFGIPKKRIAKGLGLLIAGWASMYKLTAKDEYLLEAQKLAQWLLDNPSPGYANLCWGYPFDWQSVIFIPKYTPSAVVSTVVGDGLWELFSITRDEKYLEACASICRFITNDLNRDDMGKVGLCFSYTPIDDYHVHNANLFCGEFLARIGKELGHSEWLDLAARTADYAMSEQNPDGSIFYWGRVQNHHNPNHLDHYHTGFEIRSLFKLYQHLNSAEIRKSFERYLAFYQSNFLDPSGLPKQNPKNPLPVNIHGAAECILLNSVLSPEYPECIEVAERSLKWTIKHMQTKEGWFGHLWSPQERIDAPYLRWGQAWMLRAWAELVLAQKIQSGEWGYWNPAGDKAGRKATGSRYSIAERRQHADELRDSYKKILGKVPDQIEEQLARELLVVVVDDSSKSSPSPAEKIKAPKRTTLPLQISMPKTTHPYGSKEWAEDLFRGSESDPWGHDWRASQQARYDTALSLIARNIDVASVHNFLDVGCALGHFTARLASFFPNAKGTGADISSEAIKKCRRLHDELSFINSHLPDLHEVKESFDFICSLEVIYYVGENKIVPALKRLNNLLKPGGFMLISTYLGRPPFQNTKIFQKIISEYFNVIDKEVRYHAAYNEYEKLIRNTLEILNNNHFYNLGGNSIHNFINSGIELLSDKSFLENSNKYAKKALGEESASHALLLVRRPL